GSIAADTAVFPIEIERRIPRGDKSPHERHIAVAVRRVLAAPPGIGNAVADKNNTLPMFEDHARYLRLIRDRFCSSVPRGAGHPGDSRPKHEHRPSGWPERRCFSTSMPVVRDLQIKLQRRID